MLREMPNTVVHCKTQIEYDRLMQAYEDAGWVWCNGKKPTYCKWGRADGLTGRIQHYVSVQDGFFFRQTKSDWESTWTREISLAEFLREQGIEDTLKPEDLKEGDWVEVLESFVPPGLTEQKFKKGDVYQVKEASCGFVHLNQANRETSWSVGTHVANLRKCEPPTSVQLGCWDSVVFTRSLPKQGFRPAIAAGTLGRITSIITFNPDGEQKAEYHVRLPQPIEGIETVRIDSLRDGRCLERWHGDPVMFKSDKTEPPEWSLSYEPSPQYQAAKGEEDAILQLLGDKHTWNLEITPFGYTWFEKKFGHSKKDGYYHTFSRYPSGSTQPSPSPAQSGRDTSTSSSSKPMAEFKPGDRIVPKPDADLDISQKCIRDGGYIILTRICGDEFTYDNYKKNGEHYDTNTSNANMWLHATSISSPPSFMSTVTSFLKDLARTDDERALISAGLYSECGELTDEGTTALTLILAKDKRKDLVELAEKMLSKREKDAKKCK